MRQLPLHLTLQQLLLLAVLSEPQQVLDACSALFGLLPVKQQRHHLGETHQHFCLLILPCFACFADAWQQHHVLVAQALAARDVLDCTQHLQLAAPLQVGNLALLRALDMALLCEFHLELHSFLWSCAGMQ
jgi:hypothetical protein